jgi:carbon starvation protein
LGSFLEVIGLPYEIGKSFGILAVSTFLLTTLDTSTRVGRYVFEEFFDIKGKIARFMATGATLVLPLAFNFMILRDASGNIIPAWQAVWPVFGATNQLLAGLALLVVFVWLKKVGKNTIFIIIPMIFMLGMTLWALVQLIYQSGFTIIGFISIILLGLSIVLMIEATRTLIKSKIPLKKAGA